MIIHRIMMSALAAIIGFIGAGGCAFETDSTHGEESEAAWAPLEESDECATIQAWIEANRDRLPSTYDDLSRIPMSYRRRAFATYSPVVKSSLWREHLSRYMASHPSMTLEQQAVMSKAMSILSEELYMSSGEMPQGAADMDQQLIDEAKAVFSAKEVGIIFTQLGTTRSLIPPTQLARPKCDCYTLSDQCWVQGSWTCRYGIVLCDFLPSGCGFGWNDPCNAFCVMD